MDQLQFFYENKGMREAVESFFIGTLERMAVDAVFKGESSVGYAEARTLIEEVFTKLKQEFGEKPPKPVSSSR